MPQLDWLNDSRSPYSIELAYIEDPLEPEKEVVGRCTVRDAKGYTLHVWQGWLPKQWAPQVFVDASKAAVEAYEALTGAAAIRAFRHAVVEWRETVSRLEATS